MNCKLVTYIDIDINVYVTNFIYRYVLPNPISNRACDGKLLFLFSLQINGDDQQSVLYSGNRPTPVPHPPTESLTPRTPRAPRPRNQITPRGDAGDSIQSTPQAAMTPRAPTTPRGGLRGVRQGFGSAGVKRSPSRQSMEDDEVSLNDGQQWEATSSPSGYKRMRSEKVY